MVKFFGGFRGGFAKIEEETGLGRLFFVLTLVRVASLGVAVASPLNLLLLLLLRQRLLLLLLLLFLLLWLLLVFWLRV